MKIWEDEKVAGRLDDIDMRFIGAQVLFVEDNRPLSEVAKEMGRELLDGLPAEVTGVF